MRFRWILPLAVLFPLSLSASEAPVKPRIETIVINPAEVTQLHLRPGFISTIRMPEEINSVALGSRGDFTADHSEGEPLYVYIKPITKDAAQSNLVIATKSGLHVTLELISDGDNADKPDMPVDFLLEYQLPHSSLISSASETGTAKAQSDPGRSPEQLSRRPDGVTPSRLMPGSEVDEEYELQRRLNAPDWSKWQGQQIETAIGDIRQLGNRTMLSYSIYNSSDRPVEIVPPQIQISGHKQKKKKKEGPSIISDQLEIRDYRLSTTRLNAGERADGVVVFDRPNFKQSTEKLFLQIAQADQVDHPVLIRLPFTPPVSGEPRMEGTR